MAKLQVSIEEEDRQAILLAIGHLAARRPGWDYMLGLIADNLQGRDMYESFKRLEVLVIQSNAEAHARAIRLATPIPMREQHEEDNNDGSDHH